MAHVRGRETSLSLSKGRTLLNNQRTLRQALTDLEGKIKQGDANSSELLCSVAAAQASLPSDDQLISRQTLALLYPEYCPPGASGLAQKVFDVPELLEMILSHLEVRQLLAVQTVNRQFRDAVNTSVSLQRKMSLLPHASTNFDAPFQYMSLPGWRCEARRWVPSFPIDGVEDITEEEKQRTMFFEATLQPRRRQGWSVLKMGSRCRRMLVTQPPVTEVRASTNCCYNGIYERLDIDLAGILMSNPTGITMGDLLDASNSLYKEHRHCPHAHGGILSTNGEVDVRTTFHASIPLRDDDPIMKARVASKEDRERHFKEELVEEHMMAAFADARLKAHMSGDGMPKFEEWRETYEPPEKYDEEDDDDDA